MTFKHTGTTRAIRVDRALACLVIAAAAATFSVHTSAASLYRWIEADGSITFSPKQPPAGVEYELVDTATMRAASESLNADSSSTVTAPATAARSSTPAAPGLAYAPSPGDNGNTGIDNGITAETPSSPAAALSTPDASEAGVPSSTITASNSKRAQCQELEKRVVSLERRLATPLSPEDMDNTVLYMARYQQSVDRFCRS